MFKHSKKSVIAMVYIVLAVFLLFSMVIATNIGAVSVDSATVFKIIVNSITKGKVYDASQWDFAQQSIIWNLRFPKVIITAITGAGLALAGVFMQVLTKNPLADPYILGISSGASTGAVFAILVGTLPFVGNVPLQAGAFVGALISIFLVLVVAGKEWSNGTTRLVLVGMAVSALFSALTNFIIFVTPNSRKLNSALFWMTGSFSGTGWSDIMPCLIVVLIGIIIAYAISSHLDAMLLGEEMARIRGVETKKIKIVIVLASTLITAVLVSVSGSIGFVGLVIPHIARVFMGTTHKRMIPFCLLFGGAFMVWADAIARICVVPSEMPVGVITSLVGVPFFLAMIRKSRYGFGGK